MNFLAAILEQKQREIVESKRIAPVEQLKEQISNIPGGRPFAGALRRKKFSVIAEVKKASPSRGVIVKDFNPVGLALEYERGGASALSVLTDQKFFQGEKAFINAIKAKCNLPVLRKDFILDEYQVFESRVLGADAILLIVRILEQKQFNTLLDCARSVGLEVFVETHGEKEIDRANSAKAEIIGINNRDLESFKVSLEPSLRFRTRIDAKAIAVSESGIKSAADVEQLRKAGFDAILVGEGIAVKSDRTRALQELLTS